MANNMRMMNISNNMADIEKFQEFNGKLSGYDNYLATNAYENQGAQIYIYSKEKKNHDEADEKLAYIVKGDDFLCFKMRENIHTPVQSRERSTYQTSVALLINDKSDTVYDNKFDISDDGDILSRSAAVLKEANPKYYEAFSKYIPGSWDEIEQQAKDYSSEIQKKKMEDMLGRF